LNIFQFIRKTSTPISLISSAKITLYSMFLSKLEIYSQLNQQSLSLLSQKQ